MSAEREWDISSNSDADKQAAEAEDSRNNWEERLRQAQETRDRREMSYFDPPEIDEITVRENFPKWTDWTIDPQYRTLIASWAANRVVYICHNCGCFGYKLGRTNPLFRCYACRSRNVTILRAGQLSLTIRDENIGINMEDVYRERQEAQRGTRAAGRS